MKVLVAEDSEVQRKFLAMVLQQLGYDPVLTNNGRQALACITREEIPLLISDWQMPDMDGLELCRRMRAPGGTVRARPCRAFASR